MEEYTGIFCSLEKEEIDKSLEPALISLNH